MYTTIWLALALFAAGEVGKTRGARWAWGAWAAGVVLTSIHVVIAMAVAHGWSHAAAIDATARATRTMFGVDWGGGVYVNYAFTGLWAAETVWWGVAPAAYARRPFVVKWMLRAFYLVIIVNAAIVFAAGWRRMLGGTVTAALLWSWIGRRYFFERSS